MSDLTEKATVAWGYSLADIERITWVAMRKGRWSTYLDSEERYASAWHAIVVALCTATEPPTFRDLMVAGASAVSDAAVGEKREHGVLHRMTPEVNIHAGDRIENRVTLNFSKYWLPVRNGSPTDGFSDHLVEMMALPKVLGVLTAAEYEALVTLAVYDGDQRAAAQALGLTSSTFYHRIEYGRRKVKAAWFDQETPPPVSNRPDACRVGHPRSEYGKRRGNTWVCRKCQNIADRRYRRKRKAAAEMAA